jgi:uncharacterized tellurite resistance protein B-like protein
MIESVLAWLTGTEHQDELQVALAALLVEAAYSGHGGDRFDAAERAVIAGLLERRFELTETEAQALLAAGEREAERSAELFRFTRLINERLSHDQRVELIEMLWEVAYADGVLDQYEDSLLRRLSGLVYVSDLERGAARRRVLLRRGLDRTIRSPAPEPAVEIEEKKSLP